MVTGFFLWSKRGEMVKSITAVKIVILILLLASLTFTATGVYSYWVGEIINTPYQVHIPLEKVEKIEVDLKDINYNLRLVPSGFVSEPNDVDEIIFTYIVNIPVVVDEVMDLHIRTTDITINNDDAYAHLVQIFINGSLGEDVVDIFNDEVIVYISIRLLEPIDALESLVRGIPANVSNGRTAYEAIHGQAITFGLLFELKNK